MFSSDLPSVARLQQQSISGKPQLLQNADNVGEDEKSFSIDSTQGTTEGENASGEPKNKELWEAANKVEGYMINFMMKQMRDTINRTKGLYERGKAEKIFQSRLDQKFAQRMAERKDFGIAETIYEQFAADNV